MMKITRRRFLAITAAAATATGGALASAGTPLRQWQHRALGARVTLVLAHPDGAAIARRAFAEIDRLDAVFSLYRADSALARLNAAGRLDAPPPELLDCLGLCATVHRATGGLFDPTVQPLWALHARAHAAGGPPGVAALAAARALIGWTRVRVRADAITLDPGMALTLNGVAQGVIADRVAALLRAEGLDEVMIDTGEIAALGNWPVRLDPAATGPGDDRRMMLRDAALASSAPRGTVFDAAGLAGHILDPRSGQPAPPRWRLVSVTAPRAGLADALSTAMVLMDGAQIARTLQGVRSARLVAALPA